MNGQVKECSFCQQKRDTYINFKPREDNPHIIGKVYMCSVCYAAAGKVFEKKYPKQETLKEEYEGAWSTACDES